MTYFNSPEFRARVRSVNDAMRAGMPFPVIDTEAVLGCSLLDFVSYLRSIEEGGIAYVPIGDGGEVVGIHDIDTLEALAIKGTPSIAERMAPYNDDLLALESLDETLQKSSAANEFADFLNRQSRGSPSRFADLTREQRKQRKRQREIARLKRKAN
jgi:hypothetical protein